MKERSGATGRLVVSGLTAIMVLGGILPLLAGTASANNMGNLFNGFETGGNLNIGNPSDSWDFWENLNSYVGVMMKTTTDFDLRVHANIGGGGAILATSATAGTSPELCIWNGNGAAGANQRSAVVFLGAGAAIPNNYAIEYETSGTISPNSPFTDSFNNNDMLDVFQVYLSAGVNYTLKFLSINNGNADYRFFLFRTAAGAWTNMVSPLAAGGFWGSTFFNTNYTVPMGGSGYYAVAIMQYNNINTNYQFVVGAPDMTVTGISISPSPLTISGVSLLPQYRPFTFTATVNNQGYGDAGPFNVSSYNDLVPWGNVSHGGLAARTSTPSTYTYNTANPDSHVLNITVDADNMVLEDGASGPSVADGNNNNSRTDCVAESRSPWTNDFDDSVPSPLSYNYYYYTYYFMATDTQTFSLWNASAGTDFDMYLYGPTGTLVATAASSGYPERFRYYSASGGYHYIQVLRASGSGTRFTFSVDDADPTIQIVQPGDGACLKGASNELRIDCADLGSGINDTSTNPVFRVDGGAWNDMAFSQHGGYNYTANLNAGQFIDGNHTLEFRAVDNAGNSVMARENIIVDNTAPSACTVFEPGTGQYVRGQLTARVSATDTMGVAAVNMLFGGALSALGNQSAGYDGTTGFWHLALDTTGYTDGPASIMASATDRAGNIRGASALPFFIDNMPPELALTWPANGSYVGGNSLPVNADASDAAGCLTVRFRIDGEHWSDMNLTGGGYLSAWHSREYADGPHTVTVIATDGAGHIVERSVTVVVDNTAPTVLWGAPDANSFISGVYTVRVKASDIVGIRSVVLSIAGTDHPMTFNSGSGYYEYPLDTTELVDGEYQLNATVRDISGLNTATAVPRNVRMDNGFPVLSVNSPGQGEVVSGRYDFDLSASDAFLDRTEFRVDALGWLPAGTWNTSRHPDGPHTVTFRAVDMMGRMSEMALGLTIDNSIPACAFMAPGNGSFVSGVVTIQVTASDAAGLAGVRLNGTGAEPLTFNPVSGLYEARLDSSVLPDGPYSLVAECSDLAGRTVQSVLQLKVDNMAPMLSVQAPQESARLSGMLDVEAVAPDAFCTTLEYQLDSLGWKPVDRALDTSMVADGPHALSVRATDLSGKSTVVQLTIFIDNTPPLLSILHPTADGAFVRGEFTLRVAVGEMEEPGSVTYSVDNGTSMPLLINRASGYFEKAIQTSGMAETGVHAVTVKAVNRAGLTSNFTRTFRVDNTAPTITVRSPTNASQAKEVVISVDASDASGISSVQARIDGGQWRDMMMSRTSGRYELKWSTGIKENGYHRFEVRTEDSLGNTAGSVHYFKVENQDWSWAVLAFLVVLIVVVVAAVAVRGRKKRPEEHLPPSPQQAPAAASQASKEFPLAGPQPYEQPGQSNEPAPHPDQQTLQDFQQPSQPYQQSPQPYPEQSAQPYHEQSAQPPQQSAQPYQPYTQYPGQSPQPQQSPQTQHLAMQWSPEKPQEK